MLVTSGWRLGSSVAQLREENHVANAFRAGEQDREIGLLGALGAKPRHVAACFCFQGFFIGVAGTVCGLALGYTFLHFRNDLIRVFTELTATEQVLARFYQFSNLPSYTADSDVVLIVVCAVVISTLAGLLPAWRAARLKPVEALRSE